MYRHIAVKTMPTKKRKRRLNQAKTLKIIATLLAILFASTISISAAQIPLPLKIEDNSLVNVPSANVFWAKTYGGVADDRAFYALPTISGYLVIGSSKSIVENKTVGWILKLNENGDALWNKTFLEGWGSELRYAVNLTDGYLLVGNEFFSSGQISGFVARIDYQGDLKWVKNLTEGATCKLFSGIATPDGFVVFGLSAHNINGKSSIWVSKLDLSGNLVWSITYGGSADCAVRSGLLTQNGDYLLAGYQDSTGEGNYDFYLLELGANGNLVWNKTYGGEGSQKAYSIVKANNGYVVVGDIQIPNSTTNAWVLKVDLAGNVLWNKSVGGKEADSAAYVTTSKEGGYLVAGFTFSFGGGNRDFWLFKISDSGKVLWSSTQGDQGFQEAYTVIEADNNTYIMVGWTDPIDQPALIAKATYDFSIVKLCVSPNISNFSSYQLITYAIVAISVSIITFALTIRWRVKMKNRRKNRS
jgi:hypothetical protein